MIQMGQEEVVKGSNEEEVQIESPIARQLEHCVLLVVFEVGLASAVGQPNFNSFVFWPALCVNNFVALKEIVSPKKCFHSCQGLIWNGAGKKINVCAKKVSSHVMPERKSSHPNTRFSR